MNFTLHLIKLLKFSIVILLVNILFLFSIVGQRLGERRAEIVISEQAEVVPSEELIKAGYYSKSGVLLVDFETGFSKFWLSRSGTVVCLFEESGPYIDTADGFKVYKHLDVSVLQAYLLINEPAEKFKFLYSNIVEIQQAYRYEKLHAQYLNSIAAVKEIKFGCFNNYEINLDPVLYEDHYEQNSWEYQNKYGYVRYIATIEQFKLNVEKELSSYIGINNIFYNDELLNVDQILYNIPLVLWLTKNYPDSTVKILPIRKKYNESDALLINNVTNEALRVQFKTILNPKDLKLNIARNIERYSQYSFLNKELQKFYEIEPTNILLHSSKGAVVRIDVNQESLKDLFNSEKHPSVLSILNSSAKIRLADTELHNLLLLNKVINNKT